LRDPTCRVEIPRKKTVLPGPVRRAALEISPRMPFISDGPEPSGPYRREPAMRDKIASEVKTAMKGGNKERLSTLRLIQAAIKDRDIANRGGGKEAASDDEIAQLMAKMVKQREDSAKAYDEGNRPELAAKEREEIAVIRDFMPKQLGEAETEAAIRAAIAETGAAGVKDMGKVMAALREKFAGQMDFGKASGLVKGLLNA
jgi:uncharacterized protein YqeY